MRASRLLAMLILLQLRTRLTASALAAEFEVSERTIYRDIDALSAAGIPVYGDPGPGGGFQLLDGWRTRLTGLDGAESQALPLAGLPGAAAALGLGQAAGRAQAKLLAALTEPGRAVAGRMRAAFHLDPVDWYQAEEDLPFLPELTRAVLDQRLAAIRYVGWRGVRERRIAPLGLVLKAGRWYCVAAVDGDVRTYRVGAIERCEVEEARFERPTGFDLAAQWRTSLLRFERELRPGEAHLRVSAEGLRRLTEAGAYAARAAAGAEPPGADGWAAVTLPVEAGERGALTLLALGDEVEVLGPAALRAELAALAARVAARHR